MYNSSVWIIEAKQVFVNHLGNNHPSSVAIEKYIDVNPTG